MKAFSEKSNSTTNSQTGNQTDASNSITNSQTGECESVCSGTCPAKDSFVRVEELLNKIVAEERLLEKAVEIADLVRSARAATGNCKELGDDEKCVVSLEKEIQQRELRLLEFSQLHEKEEQDLEELRLSMQARQQDNHIFEKQVSASSEASTAVPRRQARHSMPPKPPSANPQMSLASTRRVVRSPSPPGPPCGAAGRAAASSMAVARAVSRDASARKISSLPGTPEAGRGFRTPRQRSLSLTSGGSCARGSSSCGSVVGSLRSGSSTTAPSEESSCVTSPEKSRKEYPLVQHYTGGFTHPSFGLAEIPIKVTLLTSSYGHWNTLGQSERITVQRDGKKLHLSDEQGATAFDGHEIIGGILIGSVSQSGVPGGEFQLQPCKSPPARPAVVHQTCIHKHVHVPVVPRWCAVGIPLIPAAVPVVQVQRQNHYVQVQRQIPIPAAFLVC